VTLKFDTDIDIDVPNRDAVFAALPLRQASIIKENRIQAHPSGTYLQDIPVDPETGLSSLDYERAEELGYFKIDFLTNTVYDGIRDQEHLLELMHREPPWELFLHHPTLSLLPQLSEWCWPIVEQIKPKSVYDLAVIVALIRPNKSHLAYKHRSTIEKEIWAQGDKEEGHFKKGHALAVAYQIVIKLNLLVEQAEKGLEDQKELFG